jgi:hypothetical protein
MKTTVVNLVVCYWNILIIDAGFEVLSALPKKSTVFWDVALRIV